MKVTIEDDKGEISVFEGVVYTYQLEPEFILEDQLHFRQPKRTGSGDLTIEMRYHNGPRD
jgi:hypothetical protein